MNNEIRDGAMPHPSQFLRDSVFWIDVDKIRPNPFQPRKEFDDLRLKDLSESIRMYGVLQPLVVTRKEIIIEGQGLSTEYELISGERRLRASKLAGLSQVPALIRHAEDDDRTKLELAIIENLQREDLNAVDRARAFERLVTEFGFKHVQIAQKMGKSREYVTNTLRLLSLPADILDAVSQGRLSEGHTRPLLMLADRPEEQSVLFKEILLKRLTVREAELIARKVAVDRVRKKERGFDPEILALEERFRESLGTRVHIERRDAGAGGKLTIDFFSPDDLRALLTMVTESQLKNNNTAGTTPGGQVGFKGQGNGGGIGAGINTKHDLLNKHLATPEGQNALQGKNVLRDDQAATLSAATPITVQSVIDTMMTSGMGAGAVVPAPAAAPADATTTPVSVPVSVPVPEPLPEAISPNDAAVEVQIANPAIVAAAAVAEEVALPVDDRSKDEINKEQNEDDSLYTVKNFTI